MAKNYSVKSGMATRNVSTPQMVQARSDQVQNAAGGYVFPVSSLEQLRRWCILGSTGGTYYISEKKLTKDNAQNILDLFKHTESGKAAVDEIVKISDEGRAPKNDPALFAMALASSCENEHVRSYALSQLPKVARIGTFLFTYITYVDQLRGWGRGLRSAITAWYNEKDAKQLAFQVCKYPQRRVENELPWSHRDLLRKIHLTPKSEEVNTILRYVVKGREGFTATQFDKLAKSDELKYIWAHETAKASKDEDEIVSLIKGHGLVRESIPNTMFTKKVWKALLDGMPMTAMIRNIRNMTKAEVLAPLSTETKYVCETLRDEEKLHKARIHPLNVLAALIAYDPTYGGYGYYGSNPSASYSPILAIVSALEDAFYKSFKNVEPTNQNLLLAVDVSGSMTSPMPSGIPGMSCNMGAAAMAMVIARTEPNHHIVGFSHEIVDLGITSKDSLKDAMIKSQMDFGATDCALAAQYATEKRLDVDAFIVFSDMETFFGNEHPYQSLKKYRSVMNKPNAKGVAVGMVSTNSTISDSKDKNSLSVIGFDTSCPQIISDFIRGTI
jgi:60 kDa SS-A/Ro ribonucleoprotein